jgi:hypothetical protein
MIVGIASRCLMLSTSVMTTEMRAAVFYVSNWRTTYVVLVNAGTTTQQLSTLRFSIVNQAGMVMTTIAYIRIDFRAERKLQRIFQCFISVAYCKQSIKQGRL